MPGLEASPAQALQTFTGACPLDTHTIYQGLFALIHLPSLPSVLVYNAVTQLPVSGAPVHSLNSAHQRLALLT